MRISSIQKEDSPLLAIAFAECGIQRSREYFTRCFEENETGKRKTFVARFNDDYAGVIHLLFVSEYSHFRDQCIPEINDLIVIPKYRRKGIARALLRECEAIASEKYGKIGLGVGLYKDYGAAHRLYAACGYIPDGQGLIYRNQPVAPGSSVRVDDELLIYLYKSLRCKENE